MNTSYNSIVFSCNFGKIIEDDERTSIFETSTAKRLAESAGSRLCLLSDRGKWRVPTKGLPSKWNAAVALSLFMAAWLPASAAWSSCAKLTTELLLANQGREENPVKPQDVTAEGNMVGSGFTVSWSLPSNRLASTYTGFRIHFTHEASEETKYYDRTRTDTFFDTFGCYHGLQLRRHFQHKGPYEKQLRHPRRIFDSHLLRIRPLARISHQG